MAKSRNNATKQTLSYRHGDKRKNNPHVGMVDTASDGVEGQTTWAYDPHIDPALNFDPARAGIEHLIDTALASGDAAVMRQALEQLRRMQSPYLNWTGKAERTSFAVDTVSLHVHERIDPATILAAVQKRLKGTKGKSTAGFQPDLFAAPFENLPLREAIDFYKHERDWANRLIAGDSLLVMNSLLQKEGMAGQVQMIYIDPPYGIKYGSNFQPFTHKRDVKDRSDTDLTQEPEMIKAFRDTWELGIHSYLTYLRDRLLLARELLSESGSVFVQISDENVHHVREIMDEVFGKENFISQLSFRKTSNLAADYIPTESDFLLFYAKDRKKVKYRQLFVNKDYGNVSTDSFGCIEFSNGDWRRLNSNEKANPKIVENQGKLFGLGDLTSSHVSYAEPFDFCGRTFSPKTRYWSTTEMGLSRIAMSRRLATVGDTLRYRRHFEDFPVFFLGNNWTDTGTGTQTDSRTYVVQTGIKVIERCLLMTTDPGDLVLDPTCGSGTTAFVAEKWGRRWITTDTSRVAITLAKQRLTTASYDYYDLKYPHEGLKGGFVYKTVPHITLKSIANNAEIDEIYERLHPAVEGALGELDRTLDPQSPVETGREDKPPQSPLSGGRKEPAPLIRGKEKIAPLVRGKEKIAPLIRGKEKTAPLIRGERGVSESRSLKPIREEGEVTAPLIEIGREDNPLSPPYQGEEEKIAPLNQGEEEKIAPLIRGGREETAPLIRGKEETAPLIRGKEKIAPLIRGERGVSESRSLKEWEVPFDFPHDWPPAARTPFDAFHAARQAMQKKIDESIAARADQETLYDQPRISKTKLRITGPFTVEAVPFPTVLGLDEAEQPLEADASVARSGETARQGQWRDELLKAGIRGKAGQQLQLADLEPLPDARYIHAVGTVAETGERVAVSFGPEHAALEQRQVEIAMREAGALFPLPAMLVFCAFTFDPEAAKDIDNIKGITALKAQMNTDLLTEDLKKARTGNESFWLMGQPDVEIHPLKNGKYQVEVHGFDYFDTKTGELKSGGKHNIALWSLDTDYDDRSLFPRQVFFPMSGAKDGWNKLKKDIKAELNEDLLARFQGTNSLPFEPGDNRRIAVKIVDDRGIESLKVMDIAD